MFVWPYITDTINKHPTRCNNNNFIYNFNQLNMFRAIISPILRSTRLCLQLWYNAPTMLPAADSIVGALYHSCKHSLVLLRMGEIIARNMLSWLKLLIKWLLLHLVGYLYYCTYCRCSIWRHKRFIYTVLSTQWVTWDSNKILWGREPRYMYDIWLFSTYISKCFTL